MSQSQWTRAALRMLPKSLQYRLLRRSLNLTFDWPEDLVVKVAETAEEFEDAFRLSHDMMKGQAGFEPHPSGMLVLPQHILPQASVVIAKWKGKLVAAVSLISDNPLGLPMDQAAHLRSHRAGTRRLAELTAVALAPEHRADFNRILLPLLKYVFHISRKTLGLNRVVARLEPKQLELCRAVLGFDFVESRAPIRSAAGAAGTNEMSVFIDLENFEKRLAFTYAYKPRNRNLMTYFHTLPDSQFMMFPPRKYHHVPELAISPDIMERVLFKQAALHERLTQIEMRTISRFYRHANYHRLFAHWTGFKPAKNMSEWRIDTHLPGDLGLASQKVEVWNASRHGLFITTQTRLERGQAVCLRVNLNDRVQAKFQGEVQWIRRAHEYGIRITAKCPHWTDMIDDLEKRFLQVASESRPQKAA